MSVIKYLLIFLSALIFTGCSSLAVNSNLSSNKEEQPFRTSSVVAEDIKNENALRRDIIILGDKNPLRVKVRVFNNRVLLVGEVENYAIAEKLEIKAARKKNIKKVFNRINSIKPIPPYKALSDLLLQARIGFSMAGVKEFDATRINYLVDRGRVYLMGLVYREEAQIMIERFSRIEGVKEVLVLFIYID